MIELAGNSTIRRTASGSPPSLVYPFDWTGLEDFSYLLDSNGIPKVAIGTKGLQYNPITVAQYGLHHLQIFANNQADDRLKKVMNCVSWLVERFQDWHGEMGAWIYDYDLDFYGPQAPWISAMAQGQGISLLLRVYPLQPEDRWVDITYRALQPFYQPVSKGGVAASFPDGEMAFEEFPTNPPSLVLNGSIFAMLGIYDFAKFHRDQKAANLFDAAVDGLKKNLHRYDTGYWNLYDLHPTARLASPMYLEVHVRLLGILTQLTGDGFFAEYAVSWRKYLSNPICRVRWFLRKSLEKIRLKR